MKIGRTVIEQPVMNASGVWCTTKDELFDIATSRAGAIVTKSCTIKPRGGNEEPRVAELAGGHIQSIGLANGGYGYYASLVPELKKHKPVIASIAGFTTDEYAAMAEALQGADALEMNLSCPNVGKRISGYYPEDVFEIVSAAKNKVNIPIGAKLPPYANPKTQEDVADALFDAGADFITAINSIGNCTAFSLDGKPMIAPVFGALCGPAIKPLALGNVMRFRELLPDNIKIIGVGGISSAQDVQDFFTAGADAVQVGSALIKEGPGIFARLTRSSP